MNRSRNYYDNFSKSYEDCRGYGYHRLLDDLEISLATRYCHGKILEAGCGTGLILERLAQDRDAVGIDLSGGMLRGAQRRKLDVVQGSVDGLPFPNESFDSVCSFKVLAHVPRVERALHELTRVTRPGGHLVLEFYNGRSLRGVIKRLKAPTQIAQRYTDDDVFTRFDTVGSIKNYLPDNVEVIDTRGIRVVTPFAQVHEWPLARSVFGWLEHQATKEPIFHHVGGFLVVIVRKKSV